jgi:hypothetical protein
VTDTTQPTTQVRPEVPIELGHPVRSFVVALVLIAATLVAIQAAGIVQPRVSNDQGRSVSGVTNGRAWVAAVVINDGPLRVRIQSVRWPVNGAGDAAIELLPPGISVPGQPPRAAGGERVAPFSLDPGERRVVMVSAVARCPGSFSTGALHAEVRSPLGAVRDLQLRRPDTFDAGCR